MKKIYTAMHCCTARSHERERTAFLSHEKWAIFFELKFDIIAYALKIFQMSLVKKHFMHFKILLVKTGFFLLLLLVVVQCAKISNSC